MTNGDKIPRAKHLESAAINAKRYFLAEMYEFSQAVLNDLPSDFSGATSVAGGTSGLVPAPAAGDNEKFLRGDGQWATVGGGGDIIIGTTPSTVNGAIWLEV